MRVQIARPEGFAIVVNIQSVVAMQYMIILVSILSFRSAVDSLNLTRRDCPEGYLRCESGEYWKHGLGHVCISPRLVCNNDIDCSDGSDEKYCRLFNDGKYGYAFRFVQGSCKKNHVMCRSGLKYSQLGCIGKNRICDGVKDCRDNSDEQMCPYHTHDGFSYIYERGGHCPDDRYSCPRNDSSPIKCINKSAICDGVKHCPDGTDEIFCPYFFPPPLRPTTSTTEEPTTEPDDLTTEQLRRSDDPITDVSTSTAELWGTTQQLPDTDPRQTSDNKKFIFLLVSIALTVITVAIIYKYCRRRNEARSKSILQVLSFELF